jgi:hypothetical protein
MGFVFQPTTGVDTLYLAGGADNSGTESTLATLSFPSLVVTPVGTISAGSPELTGTGDGALWGFSPPKLNTPAMLFRIDPASAAIQESYRYPSLPNATNWAIKFWGGSFWIFLGSSVYQVSRTQPDSVQTVLLNSGHRIVGAGVSTCAPVQ